ncbi:AMP-binding protein [Nonomuraea longicatena]|uniref:Acyl-CoA synthetase n=1 Tax=Nonomuraea longicatena TaxID=83682 RepID=A0ABP4AAF3_9ACTN
MSRTFHLADLFETVAEAVPERVALVAGARRLTYRDLDRRADRCAGHLARRMGVRPGDRVGVLAHDRAEWKECELACFKLRAVPVNLDYRHDGGELGHVLRDSGAGALVGEPELLARVPWFANTLAYGEPYERALAEAVPAVRGPRSGDDPYLLYTGGATGRPKGVLWRHEDAFFGAMGGGAFLGCPVSSPRQLADNAVAGVGLRMLSCSPLMQAAGQWLSWVCHTTAGTLVLWTGRGFDPRAVVALAAAERAQVLALAGDAMAVPLLGALRQGDLVTLAAVVTGAATMSPEVKQRLHAAVPGLAVIFDALGGCESGAACLAVGGGFEPSDGTAVLGPDLRPVEPGGSGMLARTGRIPLRYWSTPGEAVFREDADGRRWVLQGDLARVEDDGTITLLGREHNVIRTGGRAVQAEEVEAVVRAHPAVYDAVVVGVPDPGLGQLVAVIVAPLAPLTLAELAAHCGRSLAAYQVPRVLKQVGEIQRSPAGKADYTWARSVAQT